MSKQLLILALIVSTQFLTSCSTIKSRAYELGIVSANTDHLDADEKSFFEANRTYLFRNEISSWLSEKDRSSRNKIRLNNKFDELIIERRKQEKLDIASKSKFLKNPVVVKKGEDRSGFCSAKSSEEDLYPDKDLGDVKSVIDYRAFQLKSNYAQIISYFGNGKRVKFFDCPAYAYDIEIAKKTCLNKNAKQFDACLMIDSLAEKSSKSAKYDFQRETAKESKVESLVGAQNLLVFHNVLCGGEMSPPEHTYHCQKKEELEAEKEVSIVKKQCEASQTGRECLPHIPKLKNAGYLKSAIYLSETACVKGNQVGCQMMSVLQAEKASRDHVATQEAAEANRRIEAQQKRNDEYYQNLNKSIDTISNSFRQPAQKKTTCKSSRDWMGNIITECDESH